MRKGAFQVVSVSSNCEISRRGKSRVVARRSNSNRRRIVGSGAGSYKSQVKAEIGTGAAVLMDFHGQDVLAFEQAGRHSICEKAVFDAIGNVIRSGVKIDGASGHVL